MRLGTDLVHLAIGVTTGLLFGSFIATLVVRFPRSETALTGRSRCDHCHKQIPLVNLIPVLSYVVQGGKARCCNASIDPIHPLAELTAALVGGLSALLGWPEALASAWFGWALLTLGLIDFLIFRLPNIILVSLGCTGIAAALLIGSPGLSESAIGVVFGYAVLEGVRMAYRALRGRDGLGAGDPKMFGAIGAWVGWANLMTILLLAACAGLLIAALMRLTGRPVAWSDRLPFGTLLALAAWPVWFWTIGFSLRA